MHRAIDWLLLKESQKLVENDTGCYLVTVKVEKFCPGTPRRHPQRIAAVNLSIGLRVQ